MELLQEIAVESVGRTRCRQHCHRNPAARPVPRVFRVAVCAPSELRFDYQPLFSTF